ncbi:hypothetical protein [uncultured Campylobacter sp.]|uniref:hypothetical protein n=1 Tax=uncultured Campylobacter sp. TaxID=218934 RepID=UPI002604F93B|nr:hypothetical protein [uncultured Campylobacter sp.]
MPRVLDILRSVCDKFKCAKFKVHKPGEGENLKQSLSSGAKPYIKFKPFCRVAKIYS